MILDEAVLRPPGRRPSRDGPAADGAGRGRDRPDVIIQVLPFTSGANAGMDGHFVILAFGTAEDPPVAYVEGLMGDVYVEAAEEVDRFSLAWTYLVTQALDPAESAAMIRALAQRSSRNDYRTRHQADRAVAHVQPQHRRQ